MTDPTARSECRQNHPLGCGLKSWAMGLNHTNVARNSTATETALPPKRRRFVEGEHALPYHPDKRSVKSWKIYAEQSPEHRN